MTPEGIEAIKRHEGLVLKAYRCPAGVLSIGYGHTRNVLEADIITEEIAETLLKADLQIAEKDARSLVYVYEALDPVRQDALVNMAFNLGKPRLAKFTSFLNYMRLMNYTLAASALERSLWKKQVRNRANDVIQAIREGSWV